LATRFDDEAAVEKGARWRRDSTTRLLLSIRRLAAAMEARKPVLTAKLIFGRESK
jgi:hypothetical protein